MRKPVLAAALSRSLKDPFVPAREAALKVLLSVQNYFDTKDVAIKLFPSVVPLLIDENE